MSCIFYHNTIKDRIVENISGAPMAELLETELFKIIRGAPMDTITVKQIFFFKEHKIILC